MGREESWRFGRSWVSDDVVEIPDYAWIPDDDVTIKNGLHPSIRASNLWQESMQLGKDTHHDFTTFDTRAHDKPVL